MNDNFLKKLIELKNSDFPTLLKQISDPPTKLYAYGNTGLIKQTDTKFLCVVGSRRYTEYGRQLCQSLIEGLKGLPIIIVSGLALGIDGIAHRAALEAGLPTIAVPGSGLHPETLYPRTHYYLAEEIVAKGGLLLSEYPPMTRPSPWSFPLRNRIMAGMSHAVLVIEAEERSGTLITARLAIEYSRDVGALPGSVLLENCSGTNGLLRHGAVPITCADDVKELLGFESEKTLSYQNLSKNPYEECSKEELQVIECLYEPQTRDCLVSLTKLPVNRLQVILCILEIKGLVREAYGDIALRYPPPSAILRKTRTQLSDETNDADKKIDN